MSISQNHSHKVTINLWPESAGELTTYSAPASFDGSIIHHPSDVEYESYLVNVWNNGVARNGTFYRAESHPRVAESVAFNKRSIEIYNCDAYDITLISGVREFHSNPLNVQVVWHVTGTVTGPWSTSSVSFKDEWYS
tara:strand:- start:106 stop:516 length:411 start_codon:yes stop_codon:yes gene_type:complete